MKHPVPRADPAGGTLPALTSLRFLAALMVVAYHYLAFAELRVTAVAHGDLGVSFFFILSGFILSHVYAGRGLADSPSLRSFASPGSHGSIRRISSPMRCPCPL